MTPRGVLLLVVLLAAGCAGTPAFNGVDVTTGQGISLAPGPKKLGQSFSGRYHSAQSGEMQLVQRGPHLDGSYGYRLCSCVFEGKLWGEVSGNVAHVEFSETSPACAPDRELHGQGELFYNAVSLADGPAKLFGSRSYYVLAGVPRGLSRRDPRATSAWTAVALEPGAAPPKDEPHCP